MNEDNILLDFIAEMLEDSGAQIFADDFGGKPALVIEPPGTDEDPRLPEDHTVNIVNLSGMDAVQIMSTVFTDIPAERREKVHEIIPKINAQPIIGCFAMLPDEGYLYYRTAFGLTENMTDTALGRVFLRTLDTAEALVMMYKEKLLPVVSGESDSIDLDENLI